MSFTPSLTETIAICKYVISTVSQIINLSEKVADHKDILTSLTGRIEQMVQHHSQYIITPDQLSLWHVTITMCEKRVNKVKKVIEKNAGEQGAVRVVFRPFIPTMEKEMEKMRLATEDLEKVQKLIEANAVTRSDLRTLGAGV